MDIKHNLWELITDQCPSCAYNNGRRTQQWIYRNRVCIRFSYAHIHIHIAGRQYTREYKISFANCLAATACRHIVRGAFNSARILYTYVYTARKPELMPTPLSPRYTPTYRGIYCAHTHTHVYTYRVYTIRVGTRQNRNNASRHSFYASASIPQPRSGVLTSFELVSRYCFNSNSR